ncbi:hypothetical protein TNCV_1021691 [Trichonephila clavipes]|uniref:Uncharacterized protein n=1 Tax=Trichonephila clavipes TaxID=2585209 RepID=A0A8X6VIU5_TRICX|nr:hypothetical protein TNCV_1021691 [Trichonephila clavipes]
MEWPARSPDLNPDRTSLGLSWQKVAVLNPPPRSLHELKQGLLCVWSSLPIPVSDSNKQHGKSMPPMHSSGVSRIPGFYMKWRLEFPTHMTYMNEACDWLEDIIQENRILYFDLCVFDNVDRKVCYFRVVSARKTTVRFLNVPQQTVVDVICRFKELGNDGRRPGSGRKCIMRRLAKTELGLKPYKLSKVKLLTGKKTNSYGSEVAENF